MNALYKATVFYFMGNILTRFSGFILVPLYTNILTTTEYGDYGILMAVYAILNVLYQAGLFQGFIKFFYNPGVNSKTVFSTTLNTLVLFGFLVALFLTVLNKPLTHVFNISENLSNLLLILVWLILFDTVAYFGLHFLRTKKLAGKVVTYSVITAFFNLLLNVLFLVIFRLNILGILLAQGLANLLLLILCFKYFKKYYLPMIDWKLLRKLFIFSYPLVIAGFFGIMMNVADRFIIDYFMPRSQVGIYSLAYKLGLLMNVLVIAFRTAYLPHFLSFNDEKRTAEGHNRPGRLTGELKQTLLKLVSLMAVLFLTVVFFLRYLFQIEIAGFHLINPDFIQAAYLVPFIVLAYAFNGFSAFFSLAPYLSGKSYHFLITDVIGFSLNITLNFVLIPVYGIMGAALATLLGYYGAALYMFFVFSSEVKAKIFGKEIAAIIAGCLLSLYAASILDILFIRVILIVMFILFCLRISKLRLQSFFRLTTKHSKHN